MADKRSRDTLLDADWPTWRFSVILLDADWLNERFVVISMLLGSLDGHLTAERANQNEVQWRNRLANQSKRDNASNEYLSVSLSFFNVLFVNFLFAFSFSLADATVCRNLNGTTLLHDW